MSGSRTGNTPVFPRGRIFVRRLFAKTAPSRMIAGRISALIGVHLCEFAVKCFGCGRAALSQPGFRVQCGNKIFRKNRNILLTALRAGG
jgi:hypothetical protein